MEKLKKIAIVVVGYNRYESIKRLLDSLTDANYPHGLEIPLIISLDCNDNEKLKLFVNNFEWNYGKKKVILHEKRLGLKAHILQCGDYSQDYDGIILLEDDLIVSPNFFNYSLAAIDYFDEDSSIAGISLYSNKINQTAMLPFEPEISKYDNFFVQYAQSWGQLWSAKQWSDFKSWLEDNMDRDFSEDYIPWNVRQWGEKSWLKYHILYCIEKNKFFSYPYVSLTTNFSEIGEHNLKPNTSFQVQLDLRIDYHYKFGDISDDDSVVYDAFFERLYKNNNCLQNIQLNTICFDLYGKKENFSNYDYIASTQKMPKKVINTFGLVLRPHERNIINFIDGKNIFLYENKDGRIENKMNRDINYYYRLVGKKNFKKLFLDILRAYF